MKKNLIILLKYDSKIMNVLKSILKELDQQKIAKTIKSAHANTEQPFNQLK